jgi:hypothetical protein
MNEQQRAVMDAARVAGITVQCAVVQQQVSAALAEGKALLEADPVQEPVAWVKQILDAFPLFDDDGLDEEEHHCEWALQQDRKRLHAMLTTPPAQPAAWVDLTDEDIEESFEYALAKYVEEVDPDFHSVSSQVDYVFARAIEAKLREKNGGA